MTTNQCLELVKIKKNSRKRNLSNESEHSDDSMKSIFGNNKELIQFERADDDSLQKLALKFNCTVAEIKYANKIYNDQEFHALRTVKVPVVKDGSLYHTYTQNKENLQLGGENEESITGNVHSGHASASRLEYVENVHYDHPPPSSELCYISGEDSDYEIAAADTKHLLADKTKLYNHKHAGHPVNVCDSTLPDFMNKMDEKIKKGIEELESKNENLTETDDENVGFSFLRRSASSESTGTSLCSLTWKHLVVFIFLLAVVIPILYFKHFVKKKE